MTDGQTDRHRVIAIALLVSPVELIIGYILHYQASKYGYFPHRYLKLNGIPILKPWKYAADEDDNLGSVFKTIAATHLIHAYTLLYTLYEVNYM